MFNMQKMLKQVQKMQEEMGRVQEALANERVEGTAGGGMVKAIVTGHGDLVSISIDPSVVDPQDVSMLEDLVVAATGEALRKAKESAAERMKAVTGGLNMPGLPGLSG